MDALHGRALQFRLLHGQLDVVVLPDLGLVLQLRLPLVLGLLLVHHRLFSCQLQSQPLVVALDAVSAGLNDTKLDDELLPRGGSVVVHPCVVHQRLYYQVYPLQSSYSYQQCMFIV